MPAILPTPKSRRSVPEKPSVDGLEERWIPVWDEQGTYRFTAPAGRDDVFSIDTPPPTASGSLHIGHVFSYTHTDTIARYHRIFGARISPTNASIHARHGLFSMTL